MPQNGDDGPLSDDLEGIAALREAVERAGFTVAAVRDALATEVAAGRDSAELPLYLRMLEDGGALGTLIKLFLLAVEVPAADAEAALDGLPLERLEAMGVLSRSGGLVAAALELVPTDDLLLACDPFQKERSRSDHVLGVSPPARVLAWLTVRAPVASALDLGTGNGQQALQLHRHAGRVVAVDINPRALRFAAFNAALNGKRRIEFREGDLFEPVAGEQFDLIVCNPPYVISPETDIVYRDGGLPGDSFSEKVVRELPSHLRPGGIGQVLISWVHPDGGDWTEPVRRWVEGSGCDAFLIRYSEHGPLDYAAAWNRPYRSEPEVYGNAIARWTDYFDGLGIERISWGALTLRRRDGANWFFPYASTTERISGASEQMLRLIAAQDFLVEAGEEGILDAVVSLAPEHRLEQTLRLEGGAELVERCVLRLDSGLRFEASIDQAAERLLLLLDGERPLRPLLAEVAAAIPNVSEEEFTGMALPVVRRLIELGFVVPAAKTG